MNHRFNFVRIKKAFILSFFVLGSICVALGQQTQPGQSTSNNWQVGFNMGTLGYFGDVNTSKNIVSHMKMGFEFTLSKQISPLFGIKGDLLIGKLQGKTDSNLEFNSDLVEAMINASINFSTLCWGENRNQMINIYGLAGLGLGNFNGSTINKNTGATVHSFGHDSGKGINGYEIGGLGNLGVCVDFDLGNNMKATIESAFKFTADDKLDGVVSGFSHDVYNYTSLGIAYKFPTGQKYKRNARSESVIPPIIKPTVPEKKEQPSAAIQEAKKVDSIIKPLVAQKEIKKEADVQSPDSVDMMAKKIEQLMAKNSKKDELPADRSEADRKAKDAKAIKPAASTDDMDSYTGYKVQLFATQKSMPVEKVKAKYPFSTSIRVDKANNLFHCSIGTFATFKEANKYSLGLHKKKGLQKTFVVYFKNGKRIGLVKK